MQQTTAQNNRYETNIRFHKARRAVINGRHDANDRAGVSHRLITIAPNEYLSVHWICHNFKTTAADWLFCETFTWVLKLNDAQEPKINAKKTMLVWHYKKYVPLQWHCSKIVV